MTEPIDQQGLKLTAGQCSRAGKKPENEDSLGLRVPEGELLLTKGVAAVVCDGMSACEAGKDASALSVQTFLDDYFTTPDSWTVKTSATKVMSALNSWLYSQGQKKLESAKGMVTTFSAVVIKSNTAHLLHIGDSRIYLWRQGKLEQLTQDHRIWLNNERDYLSRALGIDAHAEIDYKTVLLEPGDRLLLTTDGVHDALEAAVLEQTLTRDDDLDTLACELVDAALNAGSRDNLTALILHIESLPGANEEEFFRRLTQKPFPPPLEPGMVLDGYRILRELHASKRTQVYLAEDTRDGGRKVVLKTPSLNFQDDPAYIDRFLHEEWVGRRIENPNVLRICSRERSRQFLYYVTEYVDGQTLRQWMHDHPQPTLAEVREIARQIAHGLRAFHRLEMIHQDLKPENVMIDKEGVVKVIDFGSTKIAGLAEMARPIEEDALLGTLNYAAPEYHLGEPGSNRSDIFSLAVIVYEMLTGRLPYGEIHSHKDYLKSSYTPAHTWNPSVPAWVDGALKKALSLRPEQRHSLLSAFIHDLEKPNPKLTEQTQKPLLERNPVAFWQSLALLEALALILILWWFRGR